MFYEIGKINKIWKYIIGKKRIVSIAQNKVIIFVKSQNLTNTFNSIFQTRFKILHCYRMSNNPLTYIKVSLSLSKY